MRWLSQIRMKTKRSLRKECIKEDFNFRFSQWFPGQSPDRIIIDYWFNFIWSSWFLHFHRGWMCCCVMTEAVVTQHSHLARTFWGIWTGNLPVTSKPAVIIFCCIITVSVSLWLTPGLWHLVCSLSFILSLVPCVCVCVRVCKWVQQSKADSALMSASLTPSCPEQNGTEQSYRNTQCRAEVCVLILVTMTVESRCVYMCM